MRSFVDILDELKYASLKTVNSEPILQDAWESLRVQRGHTVRTLKTELRNTLRQHSEELRKRLSGAVFTVDTYADDDDIEKISVRVAFIPETGDIGTAEYEHMMLHILVDTIRGFGLESLANDVCVNSLQHRFNNKVV